MKILVIGGNKFFGKKLVERLLDQDHDVTVINRGNVRAKYKSNRQPVIRLGDRNDPAFLQSVAQSEPWDVVYDQVCYVARQARQAVEVFAQNTKKYIFTSSQAIYPRGGIGLTESLFNPAEYRFATDANSATHYGEAKRQCEAVLQAGFGSKFTCVRFPIVVGLDDYLERLENHVRATMRGTAVSYPSLEAEISFISSDQAADVLAFLATSTLTGPVNGSSPDRMSISQLIAMIGRQVSKEPQVTSDANAPKSWLDWGWTYTMNCDRLASAGLTLDPMAKWLPELIDGYAARENRRLEEERLRNLPLIFPADAITGKIGMEIKEPFRVLRIDNVFSPSFYQALMGEFQKKLSRGLHDVDTPNCFSRSQHKPSGSEQQYGAYILRIGERERSPFGIFYSRMFFDWMQSLFSFRFAPHLMGSLHHHPVGSKTGWIHTDYHYCNFHWSPNPDRLNPWMQGTKYQGGYDQRPEVLKCVRSVAILYYFGNGDWSEGDGGETCFFKTTDWKDLFVKLPPRDNTLAAFEVGPESHHTFQQNMKVPRNCVAFWFHSEISESLLRFGVFPCVG